MMQKSFAPILIVFLIAVLALGGFLIYQKQTKPVSIALQTLQTSPTPFGTAVDETANWKIYENNNLGVGFKYPSDWGIVEYKDFVGVIKDPDMRTIVGACPGYSFVVRKFDPKENYQIYQPIGHSIFKDQEADIYEKINQYGCKNKIIFINQFPTEKIKPTLIISMTTKNPHSKLFDQILSTFKFTP